MHSRPGGPVGHKRPWELPDTAKIVERRWPPVHTSPSFWVAVVIVLLTALLWFPTTATLVAMLGGLHLYVLLITLLALSLTLEALFGAIPRWLLALPVLYFGGYYAALETERRQVQAIELRLQSENARTALQSDIGEVSVMVPYAYRMLAARHELDSVLAAPGPGPTREHVTQWTPIIQNAAPHGSEAGTLPCAKNGFYARDSAGNWLLPQTDHLLTREDIGQDDRTISLCVRVAVIDPLPQGLEIRETPYEMAGVGNDFQATRFSATRNGALVGSAITARTWLLGPFPVPMFGCFLISGPSARTECGAQFRRNLTTLSTDPDPAPGFDRSGPAMALDLKARAI
ncbi:hypothetical protein [Pelagibacterium halotolerans]|uniref:Uncharacterized protein n=1 Tax=Pelagibacterium halotolerans (strain DSM 22347 / JCM 15775 / CGMCC 1.7692 / B2) TaxID=1082931 RepID=G4RF37_PELHB|nr:hypothetical protein [Pelagibacterium halotolerans]AEQ52969.1 hypothetical protein KKY_2975 [Pelagibacterium halotolerans B2]QJR17370.1 hypothetical protein HKM20_02190 [Pelagibacterium halotolerans]SEA97480.1 hypothetical protein SAMN05428936_1169 [Pelagibacterium halotolerans]